jgi:hypothetical protein
MRPVRSDYIDAVAPLRIRAANPHSQVESSSGPSGEKPIVTVFRTERRGHWHWPYRAMATEIALRAAAPSRRRAAL